MLQFDATTTAGWQQIMRREFTRCEISGDDSGFAGSICLDRLPGKIRLATVSAETFDLVSDAGWSAPDDLMIVFHEAGAAGVVEHRGFSTEFAAGSAVSVRMDRPYRFRYSSPVRQVVLRLPREAVPQTCFTHAGAVADLGSSATGRLLVHAIEEISSPRRDLHSPAGAPPSAELPALTASLRDLVAFVFGPGAAPQPAFETHPQLQRAKDIMVSGMRDSGFRSDDVARALGVSTRRLSAIFAAEKVSPASYLRNLRIERAIALLKASAHHLTVADIAHEVGFTDVSTFGRAFKKRFGVPPTRYRAKGATEKRDPALN